MDRHGIIIATPHLIEAGRLRRIVAGHPDFTVVASTTDLMSTYAEVEDLLPRAVLISETLAILPEFEVMHALFSALDVRWLVVTPSSVAGRAVSANVQRPSANAGLFTIAADADEMSIMRQLRSLTLRPTASPSRIRQPSASEATGTACWAPGTTARGLASHEQTHSRVVLIGASTGGVDALLSVLAQFPVDCPPTLIVQHTGAGFGESLVGLLNRQCLPQVELATETAHLRPGKIIVGAGTRKHLVIRDSALGSVGLVGAEPVAGHVPAVDCLFDSAVPIAPRVIAALLTGMGRDGAAGLRRLRDAGASTIAQDEATCIVYGMPRAAVEMQAAMQVLPLAQIGPEILRTAALPNHNRKEMHR